MRNIFTFSIFFLCTVFSMAQNTYLMGDVEMTTDCNGIFYDDGGNEASGFYSNQLGQEPQVFTICPENAGCIVMDFHSFVTENTTHLGPGDVLYAYDGSDTSAPLIGAYSGTLALSDQALGRITAGSGCLTLVFDENGGFSTIGWEAEWTCFFSVTCETINDLLPPNDCMNPILVCDDETLNYNSNGAGEEELLSQGVQDCIFSGETQSFWMKINISEFITPNMPLTFTISPKPGGEDYDFAIYGPNPDCGDLGQPIRCTFAEETFAGTLLTGLRMGETDISESPTLDNEGNDSNGFLAPLEVNPGEQYLIMVNNFSTNNVGFDLIWGEEVVDNNLLDCDACEHLVLDEGDMDVCVGEEFEVFMNVYKGSGFFDFDWTASIEGVSFLGQNPVMVQLPDDFEGDFTLSVDVRDVESLNCVQSNEIIVSVGSVIEAQILGGSEYCQTENVVPFIGQPMGGVFTYSDGTVMEDGLFPIDEPGTFAITYTYTEQDGCEYQAVKQVEVFPLPSIFFTASDTTILQGESIFFMAEQQVGVTYIWTVNGEFVANTFEYIFTPQNAGNYLIALEVLSDEGCAANSDFLEVVVEIDTAIETPSFFNSLQIHPNPAKDLLQISLDMNTSISKIAQIEWYNSQGQLVASESLQVEAKGWNHSVDVSDFAVGVYYLHLQAEEGIAVEKVLIVR